MSYVQLNIDQTAALSVPWGSGGGLWVPGPGSGVRGWTRRFGSKEWSGLTT